jgi:hypothetical protein
LKKNENYRLIKLTSWYPTLQSLGHICIMASSRSSSKKVLKINKCLSWINPYVFFIWYRNKAKLVLPKNKNTVHLKREFFFTSITSLFERCPNNKWPIFGFKFFLRLNQLALLDQEKSENQLTTMSNHLDQINV